MGEDKKLGLFTLTALVVGSMIGGGAFNLASDMGKGRSNNAGKKQPNFDDSSNFAKQSQPTEKKKK
ncbi:hypothetical protein ACT4UM_10955 [Bacillus sp. SS-TM]